MQLKQLNMCSGQRHQSSINAPRPWFYKCLNSTPWVEHHSSKRYSLICFDEFCQTHRSKILDCCSVTLRCGDCKGHSIWWTSYSYSSNHLWVLVPYGRVHCHPGRGQPHQDRHDCQFCSDLQWPSSFKGTGRPQDKLVKAPPSISPAHQIPLTVAVKHWSLHHFVGVCRTCTRPLVMNVRSYHLSWHLCRSSL